MSIGAKWLRRAEAAAAGRAGRTLDSAERELGELLPGARIERGSVNCGLRVGGWCSAGWRIRRCGSCCGG